VDYWYGLEDSGNELVEETVRDHIEERVGGKGKLWRLDH